MTIFQLSFKQKVVMSCLRRNEGFLPVRALGYLNIKKFSNLVKVVWCRVCLYGWCCPVPVHQRSFMVVKVAKCFVEGHPLGMLN